MPRIRWRDPNPAPAGAVTPVELFAHGPLVYVLWVAAFVLMAVIPYITPRRSDVQVAAAFRLAPSHFVERHGLLVIIALGESVVAIGMGFDVDHLTVGTIAATVLALALPAAMWWTYFTDAAPAEHALDHAAPGARGLLAIRAYFYAHIAVLLGIVFAAVVVLATIPLATTVTAGFHLAAVAAIVTVMLLIDSRMAAVQQVSADGYGLRAAD